MTFRIPLLAAALLASQLLPAQQETEAPPPSAEKRLEELREAEQALVQKFFADRQAAMEAAQKAEPGQPAPAIPMRPDFSPLLVDYQKAANDYAETDDAVPFLLWIVQRSDDSDAKKQVVNTLVEHHAASSKLTEVGPMLQYLGRIVSKADADRLVNAMTEHNKDPNMQGWLALYRLGDVIDTADREGEEYAAARAALLAAKETANDRQVQSEIQSRIDLREKYGVGCVAPDIAGIDLDGEEFKLSDYQGKIIFLDFWGDW